MKALRISLPSSPLTGIFCRFGSLDERRPVAVVAWLKEVCMWPVRAFISFGRASIYVPSSFFSPRCSSIASTILCFPFSDWSTSSLVTYCPVFVFFAFSTICSLSKSTSPTCLGDAMLNGAPASSYISFSTSSILFVSTSEVSASDCVSIVTPFISISANTGMRGISML